MATSYHAGSSLVVAAAAVVAASVEPIAFAVGVAFAGAACLLGLGIVAADSLFALAEMRNVLNGNDCSSQFPISGNHSAVKI